MGEPKCNLWTFLLPASFGCFFFTFGALFCCFHNNNSCCSRARKVGLLFMEEILFSAVFCLEKPPFDILCLYCAVVHGAYGPLNLLCTMHNAQFTMTSITIHISQSLDYDISGKCKHFKWFLLCGKRNGRITDPHFTFPAVELRSPWFPLKYYYKECEVFVGNLF